MVNGNRLERKGTLNFDFKLGACTVLNQLTIVLCFDEHTDNICRQSNNPLKSFAKLPDSNHGHKYINIASFNGKT